MIRSSANIKPKAPINTTNLSAVKYALLTSKSEFLSNNLGKSQSFESVNNLKSSTKKNEAPIAEISEESLLAPFRLNLL